MPDLFELIGRWWRQMLLIVIVAVVSVGVVNFLQPKQYLSTATAVPANGAASDRSRVFGENLQGLYSALGSPDDLDRVIGTAQLDTVYRSVAAAFNLDKHYNIAESNTPAINIAAGRLKKSSRVQKSAYGELKVKVWDHDPVMAGKLANGIFEVLQKIHTDLQSAGNAATLKGLIEAKMKMALYADSASSVTPDQIATYDRLINQYQVLLDSKPPALIVVEEAGPASEPDKPRMLRAIVVAGAASFLFALLLVLVPDRRLKSSRS